MSGQPYNSLREQLDAYLDGTLPEPARRAFAREAALSPELTGELALQKRIDQVLVHRFAPPAAPTDLAARLREAATVTTILYARPRRRRLPLAAAAVAAVVAWAILGWQFFSPANRPPVYNPRLPVATIYNTRVAEGFKPTWVCEDDHIFASTFKERQGQGLLLATMPPGSGMVGLAYCGGMSRYTTTMLARVDGKPVMVFVDRKENEEDGVIPPSPDSGLHLFQKELGNLVLYEVTPFDEPRVMDYLYAAEVPPAKAAEPGKQQPAPAAK
ncbi:MAG TPA: hypothetical protein VHD36_16855 [Pirellulales bacterium]|nr:hypothetical protein [Pirellulales bacterium]